MPHKVNPIDFENLVQEPGLSVLHHLKQTAGFPLAARSGPTQPSCVTRFHRLRVHLPVLAAIYRQTQPQSISRTDFAIVMRRYGVENHMKKLEKSDPASVSDAEGMKQFIDSLPAGSRKNGALKPARRRQTSIGRAVSIDELKYRSCPQFFFFRKEGDYLSAY